MGDQGRDERARPSRRLPSRLALSLISVVIAALGVLVCSLITGPTEPLLPPIPAATAPSDGALDADEPQSASDGVVVGEAPSGAEDTDAASDDAKPATRPVSDGTQPDQLDAQQDTKTKAASAPAPRAIAHELQGDAANKVRASEAWSTLTAAIGSFEDRGWTVAFVVSDLDTKTEISYNDAQELYPASSIKAPFTCAVYEKLVETGATSLDTVSPVSTPTILESSDEGYRTLHAMYGEDAFVSWLEDAGVGPGSYGTMAQMVAWNYPHITARQFSLMWHHIYAYLTKTDSAASRHLADLLAHREVSSLREALPEDVDSWSKMGWFESYSAYRSEPATVEGGVVFSDEGTYVLAVMTTAPAELGEIVDLLAAIDTAHAAMV